MSAQTTWWENVTKALEMRKRVNPQVDTCPLCWATSGLPAVVFKGDPDSMCGTCQDVVTKIKLETN